MSRFALKIYAVLLVMGAIPLLASALLIGEILSFNQDLQKVALETLDNVSVIHRAWARSEGERVKLIGEGLARHPGLGLAGVELDEATARETLQSAVRRYDVLKRATLLVDGQVVVDVEARDIDADALRLHDRTWAVDPGARPNPPPDTPRVLRLTFGIERALSERFEELGDRRSLHRSLLTIGDEQDGSFDDVYRTFYFTMLALVVVLTVGLALLITMPVNRRVARLAAATHAVARGDLSVQVPVKGRDELAQLTEQFNTMVSELRETRRKVAYLERVSAWQEVARRLAHEIKNPLTPILLSVQQLDKTFDKYRERPEVYRQIVDDVVEIVTEEVETLRTLVQEFRDFARLPSADPRPCGLWEFVQSTLRSNPQFAEAADIEELGGPEVRARLDPVLMRRVLVNIVQNAIEAVEEERSEPGRRPRLEIGVEQISPGMARVFVRDDGPGITAEQEERIFEPYFTTKEKGTGLGLAIVRKIAIDHGGDVQLLNRSDGRRGAEARIELPILTPDRESPGEAPPVSDAQGERPDEQQADSAPAASQRASQDDEGDAACSDAASPSSPLEPS